MSIGGIIASAFLWNTVSRIKCADCLQDPTTRTEGQADFLQIVLRQFGKISWFQLIFGEDRRILG